MFCFQNLKYVSLRNFGLRMHIFLELDPNGYAQILLPTDISNPRKIKGIFIPLDHNSFYFHIFQPDVVIV